MTDPQPVIIAGAGPVGLTAAVALARAGIAVCVLEASPQLQIDWRASTFHPPTLELLDTIDVADGMLARGLIADRWQFRDRRQGLIAEFDLGVLADDTRFPFRLQLNQQRLAGLLVEQLATHPHAEVHFGHRVVDAAPSSAGVRVMVEHDGVQTQVDGSYLLGADGASSTVRRITGSSFEGTTYEDRYLIVSTPVSFQDHIPDLAYVAYIADPDEWLFTLRIPEAWRIVFPIPPAEPAEEALSSTAIERRTRAVVPDAADIDVIDKQIYSVHQRVAGSFRSGPIMLLGDAAHINSPLGGMGLNNGIHDAFDLTRRLIRILNEGADPHAELERYGEVRRQVAHEYVRKITHRNTVRIKERDEASRRREHAEQAAIAADPARARTFLLDTSMISAVRSQGIGEPPVPATAR